MRETVWYLAKPGEDRRFALPREPSPEWAKNLKKEGYRIFRISFLLPHNWDSADFIIEDTQVARTEDV